MDRRKFVTVIAGAVVGGALGCVAWKKETKGGDAGSASGPIDAATFHASRKFANTSFGRIAYVERGVGPAALFIHGLPLNGFQWRGALERLSPYRRCIAPDSMGLGYSEIPKDQSLAPEAQAAMMAAFLDTLSIAAVDLVASDSGGAIAQIFVAHYPERVRTILLTNCDVHENSPPPALIPVIALSREGKFVDDVLVPQLNDKTKAWLETGLGGCCYTTPQNLTAEAIEVYLRPFVSSPLRKEQFHNYCIALARNPLLPIEPELRRSEVPVRVVWGMADPIFDPSGPDWIDRIFPRSRGARRIKDGKLFFPEEMPDIIAEEARRLWLNA